MTDIDLEKPEASGGFKPADLYYVLFRRKGLILAFSLLGLLGAVGIYFLVPRAPFTSSAKVFIRYVYDQRTVDASNVDGSQVLSPTSRGETIMNSEKEIVTSFDLLKEVVGRIGPERLLSADDTLMATDPLLNLTNAAATVVMNSSRCELLPGNTIRIQFSHQNAELVRPVLTHWIQSYQRKHYEVHRELGVQGETQKFRDQQIGKLKLVEADLRRLKSEAGVISVDTAQASFAEEMRRLRQQLIEAETELGVRRATTANAQPAGPSDLTVTNQTAGTPPDKLNDYLNLRANWNYLNEQLQVQARTLAPGNPVIDRLRQQLSRTQADIGAMEAEFPSLAGMGGSMSATNASPLALLSDLAALQYRVNYLSNQIARVQAEALLLDQRASQIRDLERQWSVIDESLRYSEGNLSKAQVDEMLGSSRIPNINVIQEPTPPTRDVSKRLKMMLASVAAGMAGGIGLAFVLELFLVQTIRRPEQLEAKGQIPLFLKFPEMRRIHARRPAKSRRKSKAPLKAPPNGQPADSPISYEEVTWKGDLHEPAPWDPDHPLQEYFEALRDRLVTDFELRNMTHKPKMIAVTSCSARAGVSTIATGLASSLSATSGGNVLLVDMNVEQGAAHHISNGKPGCGLNDVLESDKREAALVGSHLYLATANQGPADDKLPRILPKRFTHLFPKMKASDYDYIIFDMPPVNQTSVTARLSAFMDMTLLVVESEQSSQASLKRAEKLLLESSGSVKSILNKYRQYVPQWLSQEE